MSYWYQIIYLLLLKPILSKSAYISLSRIS